MRLLLTNDDGIQSIGLAAMAAALRDADHDVTVVAPATDRSGASASLGRIVPKDRMIVSPTTIDNGGRRLDAATMDAPPGLIVMAAALGAFGDPPDVVVSGINLGPNTGHAILHSGTVGAVLPRGTSVCPGSPSAWPSPSGGGRRRRRPSPSASSTGSPEHLGARS
jgi:5'-nucleotidase